MKIVQKIGPKRLAYMGFLSRFFIYNLSVISSTARKTLTLANKHTTENREEKLMKTIDTTVLAGYNAGTERNRLRAGIGLIEFERTKEILFEELPKPPAVIYDIGGGYGEYSWWLSSLGYEVHLFDLAETNIKISGELAEEYPNVRLKSAMVCDARSVPRPDKSADAILLMGPLYSITEYDERILAVRESCRLLKDDGVLFSAALTPYSVLIPRIAIYHKDNAKKKDELDDPAVIKIIERALTDGCYINPEKKTASGLGSSHLHTAKALREELRCGGFSLSTVHGVMGGAWLAPNLNELLEKEETRNVLLKTVRMLDTHEEIIGLSGHLLAVSRK
jgi:SAM-dependent methyltransferase